MRAPAAALALMLAALMLSQGAAGAGTGAGTGDGAHFPQPVPFPVWNVSASDEGDESPSVYTAGWGMGVLWMRELEEPSTYQVMGRSYVFDTTDASYDGMPGWDTEETWASAPDTSRPPSLGTMTLNLNPVAAAMGDRLYVVWASDDPALTSGADHDIVMRVHDATRSEWGPVLTVTPGSQGQDRLPAVAVHDGLLHIAWVRGVQSANGTVEDDIVMRTYDGAAFSEVVTVSEEASPEKDWGVDMASVGGRLVLVWERNNRTRRTDDFDVMYREWGGSAFVTPPLIASVEPDRIDRNPRVEGAGGRPFVVWESRPETGGLGGTSIMGRAMGPAGFSSVVELTRHGSPADNTGPDVVSAGGTAYVVWTTYDDAISHGPDADIVMRSYDGSSLGDVVELTDPEDGNVTDGNAAVCVYEGDVYVAWVLNRTASDGAIDFEVMCRRATGYSSGFEVVPATRHVAGQNITVLLTLKDVVGGVPPSQVRLGVNIRVGSDQVLWWIALHFEPNGTVVVPFTPPRPGIYVVTTTYDLGEETFDLGSHELSVYDAPDGDDGAGSTVYIAVMLVAVLLGAVAVVLGLRRR